MDEGNFVNNNMGVHSFSNVSIDSGLTCSVLPDDLSTMCSRDSGTTCVSPDNFRCTHTDSASTDILADNFNAMNKDSGSTYVSSDNFSTIHKDSGSTCVPPDNFSTMYKDSGSTCESQHNFSTMHEDSASTYISPDHSSTMYKDSGSTCVSPDNFSTMYTDSGSTCVSPDNLNTMYKDSGSACVSPDSLNTMYKDSDSTCVSPDNFSTMYKDSSLTCVSPDNFKTIYTDSGSTCVSPDTSYVNLPPSVLKNLETFQNLNPYPSQGPDSHNTSSTTPLSFPSSNLSLNDSNLDYSNLNNLSVSSTSSQDSLCEKSENFERPASTTDEDTFRMNASKSPDGSSHLQLGQKNKASSKNLYKGKLTLKQKQKQLDGRLAELQRENEDLLKQTKYLEAITNEYRKYVKRLMTSLHTA